MLENDHRLKQIAVQQLKELKRECLDEKHKINKIKLDTSACDFEKFQKYLCSLNVRILTIEFALASQRSIEKFREHEVI